MSKKKIFTNLFWLSSTAGVTKILQIISNIILTGLLDPEIFGLTTISLSIFFITQGILNFGFESAIIQDNIDTDLSKLYSAWTLEIIKGFILFVSLYLLSEIISDFLESEELSFLLKLTSIIFLIDCFKNIRIVILKKTMNFKKIFFLDVIPYLISTTITIILAIYVKEAWVIIFGLILYKFFYVVISYIIVDFNIKFSFKLEKVKSLFNFGKWIFLSSILTIIRVQGINVFLTKFVGFESLGVYNRAVIFSEEFFNQLNNLFWKFNFPNFSKDNLNIKKIHFLFYSSYKFMFIISLILAISILLIADSFVDLFFDINLWGNMKIYIKLLTIYSFFVVIQSPFGIFFQSMGKPNLGYRINLLSTICIIILIYPLFKVYSIDGVIYTLIISSVLTLFLNLYFSIKYFDLSLSLIIQNIFKNSIIIILLMIPFEFLNFNNFFINLLFPLIAILILYFLEKKHFKL